jgi:hypothetical protein
LHVVIGRVGDTAPDLQPYGPPLIVVLAKWEASEDPDHPGWVTDAVGLPVDVVETLLDSVVGQGHLRRPEGTVDWTTNELGFRPTLAQPQLIVSGPVRPVLASEDGILIGRIQYGLRSIWILSDPDLIANHGLHRGDNAALALAMVQSAMPPGGMVVFDLTRRYPAEPPDIASLLLRFPAVLVIAEIAIVCLLVAWATTASFGAPLGLPRPIATGSASLVDNTSALLILGGHLREMLVRYGDAIVRDATQRLHAPHGLNAKELAGWLARVETARGARIRLADLQDRKADIASAHAKPDAHYVMGLAGDFHQWRQELIRGPGYHRGN